MQFQMNVTNKCCKSENDNNTLVRAIELQRLRVESIEEYFITHMKKGDDTTVNWKYHMNQWKQYNRKDTAIVDNGDRHFCCVKAKLYADNLSIYYLLEKAEMTIRGMVRRMERSQVLKFNHV